MAFRIATLHHPLQLLQAGTILLLLAAPAASQELQELRLKDGRVLVGKVTMVRAKSDAKPQLRVQTNDGTVIVSANDVAESRDQKALRLALKKKVKECGDSAFAHVNLAKQARDYGLERDMWRHIDRALAKLADEDSATSKAGGSASERNDGVATAGQTASSNGAGTNRDGEPAPRALSPVTRMLRDFLAQLEPELLPRKMRKAPTQKRVQAMLRLFRANTGDGQAAALEELLVRELDADQVLRREARRNSNPRHRVAALRALQRRKVHGNERFVLRTTVLDRSKKVRTTAIDIGKPSIKPQDVQYMAAGLGHSSAKVRVRTAEALGGLGHPQAIRLLVKAGPYAASGLAAGGDGTATRGHIAFLNQQAYIRDYDVEVAQAAFIADPKVDALTSGTVLDVTVAGVYEIRTIVKAYRYALRDLTRQDPGPDPRRWADWLSMVERKTASKPVLTKPR